MLRSCNHPRVVLLLVLRVLLLLLLLLLSDRDGDRHDNDGAATPWFLYSYCNALAQLVVISAIFRQPASKRLYARPLLFSTSERLKLDTNSSKFGARCELGVRLVSLLL